MGLPDDCRPLAETSRNMLTMAFGESEDLDSPVCYIKGVDIGPIGFIDYATAGMGRQHATNQLELSSKSHEFIGRTPEEVILIMTEIQGVRDLMGKRGYVFSPSLDHELYVYDLTRATPEAELCDEINYLLVQFPREYAALLQSLKNPVQ